ncbi:MAG TPA: gliding motility-associated C-terminal domain-containing protein [Bacteroidia bacterium]|nr:gliding motility-associated C-terminal domain-containing protein [Bacteroidia bacterium]
MSKKLYLFLVASLIIPCLSFAGAPVINPGGPQTVCPCSFVLLGGFPTASGGAAPYTYSWSPGKNMNDSTLANPVAKVCTTTTFTLMVTDANGVRYFDSVKITVESVVNVNAGPDVSICPYVGAATLGAATNPPTPTDTYNWSPSTGLSCTTCPNPVDSGLTATTTYTLIAFDGTCHDTTTVTVNVFPPAPITTISPITIHRGQTATLNASGGVSYIWVPTNTLSGSNTATPDATPTKTTTYTVQGTDASGCIGFDSVLVNVIDDSVLFFYNTFTPNNDGINDTWYIGNIELYPNNEVLIFNRYGAQVYSAFGYVNQWDGSSLGVQLPDATYYYIVYTGTGQTYKGSVTIIRKMH